uniref:Uncharacterized protein n=1 Tax=Arundo donax TaxID=35708 RepID=A0A0A9FXW4_ARUDO
MTSYQLMPLTHTSFFYYKLHYISLINKPHTIL